jgi:hypothetical protein
VDGVKRIVLALGCVVAVSCSPLMPTPDGGEPEVDAGPVIVDSGVVDAGGVDAGAEDAGLVDAGTDAGTDAGLDAGTDAGMDAGWRAPLDGGHGVISGLCGRVAPQYLSPDPTFFEVHLDFGMDQYDDPAERPRLTPGAQTILMEGTAGGSSGISEAFAMEVLTLCEGASFVASETTVVYMPTTSKKTDIVVEMDGNQWGVSVVRAVLFPADAGYPVNAQTTGIIEGKLDDILISTMNVQPPHGWRKQVLAVLAYEQMHADSVRQIWNSLDAMTRADTVMYVIVTDGLDRPVYFNN